MELSKIRCPGPPLEIVIEKQIWGWGEDVSLKSSKNDTEIHFCIKKITLN